MSFSGDGIHTTGIGSPSAASSIAIQKDGKIVVAGYSNASGNTVFAVARYNTNGSPDNSFDGDGRVTTVMGFGQDMGNLIPEIVNSIVIQSNGKIIVLGTAYNEVYNSDFALARYNTNGSLDASFGGDGKIIFDLFNGSREFATSLKLYGDRIYVAGFIGTEGDDDFAIAAVLNDSYPLPLSFLEFSGRLINSDGVLTWKTENEANTLEFIVERSTDGRNYSQAGKINAVLTQQVPINIILLILVLLP